MLDAIILGLVQGLTEFIPVSSSGHLIVIGEWLQFEGGLTFDIALHVGTLIALVLFFWKDFIELFKALFVKSAKSKLAWLLVLATIPAAVAGWFLEAMTETTFRSPSLVAFNLVSVGLLMLLVDRYSSRSRQLEDITFGRALGVGLAQALALVPGVSRSGITITAGLAEGMDRVAATRFSFLLSAPIIAGAITKVLLEPGNLERVSSESGVFIAGMLAALVSGYLAIRFLLRYLAKHGLAVFVYYRIALALLIILIL